MVIDWRNPLTVQMNCNYFMVVVNLNVICCLFQICGNGLLLGDECGREAHVYTATSVLARILCSIDEICLGHMFLYFKVPKRIVFL